MTASVPVSALIVGHEQTSREIPVWLFMMRDKQHVAQEILEHRKIQVNLIGDSKCALLLFFIFLRKTFYLIYRS